MSSPALTATQQIELDRLHTFAKYPRQYPYERVSIVDLTRIMDDNSLQKASLAYCGRLDEEEGRYLFEVSPDIKIDTPSRFDASYLDTLVRDGWITVGWK